MCGIAGIISTSPVEPSRVNAMLASIGYRGPDHTQVNQIALAPELHVCLGQARLAILDLSAEANQPFFSERGNSLTFNGEFYNFRELAAELTRAGHRLRTRSDTEVALLHLEQHGLQGLDTLWGMFAGAYTDTQAGAITLFRDRLGKKPLVLYRHREALYFASEPKAILSALDHRPQIDRDALARYFMLGYIPDGLSIYAGMFQLAPGHLLRIDNLKSYQPERWYLPETAEADASNLRDLFFDAVAKRMISDVPLGAFLSGGLDSSLVVAAMSRLSDHAVHTFCVRFEGPQALDESGYAREVARHCGTKHSEIALNPSELRRLVPEVLNHFDEPFGDSSAVPTYLVSREARKHFTVALTGDGADEVFAGYRKYLGEHYLRRLGPYAFRRLILNPLTRLIPSGRTNRVLETGRRIRRLLHGDAADAATRHVNWLEMGGLPFEGLLNDGAFEDGFAQSVRDDLRNRLPRHCDLNQRLRFDQNLVLVSDMFVKIDRMSMKASLELRSPFVDHRILELANGLAPQHKLLGTRRKRVLIDVLGDLLPHRILARPKSGFEMPLGAWLRGDLKSWSEHTLFHDVDQSHWVDRDALRAAWTAHQGGRVDLTEPLWYHLVFANWLKRHLGATA